MKFRYFFNFWQELFDNNESVANKEVDTALGKMTVEQVYEKARQYGRENKWEGNPKIIKLWQNHNSKSLFWSIQFEIDPEIDDSEYEYAIGSLGNITIDDEIGEVIEV